MVGAAAATQHVDLRMPLQQIAVLAAELHRIAVVEVGCIVELLMAAPRGVGAQAAHAFDPGPAGQHALEWVGCAQLIM